MPIAGAQELAQAFYQIPYNPVVPALQPDVLGGILLDLRMEFPAAYRLHALAVNVVQRYIAEAEIVIGAILFSAKVAGSAGGAAMNHHAFVELRSPFNRQFMSGINADGRHSKVRGKVDSTGIVRNAQIAACQQAR